MRIFFVLILLNFATSFGQHELDNAWKTSKDKTLNDSVRCSALNSLVDMYRDRILLDSARIANDYLKEISLRSKDRFWQTQASRNVAAILCEERNFEEAMRLINVDYHSAQIAKDSTAMRFFLRDMAKVYRLINEPDSARLILDKQLDYATTSNNTVWKLRILMDLGMLAKMERNIIQASEYLTAAFDAAVICHDTLMMIESIVSNNQFYYYYNQHDAGAEKLNVALALARAIKDRAYEAKSLMELGVLNEEAGNFPTAIRFLKESSEVALAARIYPGYIAAVGEMAVIKFKLGNFKESEADFLELIPICSQLDSKEQLGSLKANLATVYYFQGRMVECKDLMISTFPIYDAAKDHRQLWLIYNNIGEIYREIGVLDSAMFYLMKSLDIAKIISAPAQISFIYNTVGDVYTDMEETDSALKYLSMSVEMSREFGNYQERSYALRSCYTLNFRTAQLQAANEQLHELIQLTKKGIVTNFPIMSESEKELYFKTISTDFDILASFASMTHRNDPDIVADVFDNVLLTKGLLLKSSTAMRLAILSSGDTILIQEYNRWLSLKTEIAKMHSSGSATNDLEYEANEIEKQLVAKSGLFADIQEVMNLTWRNVKSRLSPGDAAIEFVTFPGTADFKPATTATFEYGALLVKHNSSVPEFIPLFIEPELEKIIGTFPGNNLSYIEQVYGSDTNTKTQLYDLIWEPMEKSLEGVKKVYVSPVGLLHKISFSALAKDQDVYLSDVYDIETKASTGGIAMEASAPLSNLDAGSKVEGPTSNITLFGGIDYNSDSTSHIIWHYLDGSMAETQQISKILRKTSARVNYFNEQNATEEQFKQTASHSTILHIATHGFFYPDPDAMAAETVDENESADLNFRGGTSGFGVHSFVKNKSPLMRSGLVFAGANDVWSRTNSSSDAIATGSENANTTYVEDGVLTAQEVATIDMRNTELVVLSACETGLGDIKGSEGVYGLQRAFKMAGVKYIIMSLWQVPDKETAEFMTTFYKNLTKTNDIRKSFNLTQQAMRKKYDPYYWGAFVLIE